MDERQEYALTHPLNAAAGAVPEVYRRSRTVRGLLLMAVLAVDR